MKIGLLRSGGEAASIRDICAEAESEMSRSGTMLASTRSATIIVGREPPTV